MANVDRFRAARLFEPRPLTQAEERMINSLTDEEVTFLLELAERFAREANLHVSMITADGVVF